MEKMVTEKTSSAHSASAWRAAKDGTVSSVTAMVLTIISVIRNASHQRSFG